MFVLTAFLLPSATQNSSRFHLSGVSLSAIWADMSGTFKPVTLTVSCLSLTFYRSIKLLLTQDPYWPTMPVWTTCRAPSATPTCATPSRFWMWRQSSLSIPSACMSNLLTLPPASLHRVRLIVPLPHSSALTKVLMWLTAAWAHRLQRTTAFQLYLHSAIS